MNRSNFNTESLGSIKTIEQCDGVHGIVYESLGYAPNATHLVSTIRHPGLTSSTRLITGDVVGNIAARQMQMRDGRSEHTNLIWEANVPGSPNGVKINFRLLNAVGRDDLSITFPYQAPAWFSPAPRVVRDAFDKIFRNENHFESVAKQYANLVDLPLDLVQSRVTELIKQYKRHFVNESSHLPLTVVSQHFYDAVLDQTLGYEFASNSPQVPYIEVAKNLVLPRLRELGEERFIDIISKVYPKGVKTLFFGEPQVDSDEVVGYIGWSPQGKFVVTHDRITDGKARGSAKEIAFNEVLDLVERGRMAPIGIVPMLTMYPDESFLLHGADHGQRERMSRFISCESGVISEPNDSWPIMLVDLGRGNIAEPSLQELFILFGERNPILRGIVLYSLHHAEPLQIDLDKLKELIHAR